LSTASVVVVVVVAAVAAAVVLMGRIRSITAAIWMVGGSSEGVSGTVVGSFLIVIFVVFRVKMFNKVLVCVEDYFFGGRRRHYCLLKSCCVVEL